MAQKKIGLSFFQLAPTVEDLNSQDYKDQFKEIATAFVNSSDVTFNPLKRGDGNVNLHGKLVKKSAGYILGTLVNSQMLDIPPSYDNKTHALKPLDLAETQGLGYPTSFLFDYQANILMVEVIRNGVGVNSFCRFFRQNLDVPAFEPSIIINPIELDKFHQMTTITRFQVKIARVEDGSLFSGKHQKSLGQIIESADGTNTNALDYTISAKRSESLNIGKVRNFVSGFLKHKDSDEVKTLKVTGKEEDDDHPFPLDLIQQKLRESITVEKERFIGDFYISDKYRMMEEAYNRHRSGLLSAYRMKKA